MARLFYFSLTVFFVLAIPVLSDIVVPNSEKQITLSFAPLVKKAAPAVVNIHAKRLVQTRSNIFLDDPFFNHFFQEFGSTRSKFENSLGSGVVLSKDGIVVSNYHVVGGATDIKIILNNGKEYSAIPVLSDKESDLAILRIEDAKDMRFLPLRKEQNIEVGELVLAIGNPFGIGQTVSSGIVSGLARSGTALNERRGYFIQTDAAINPGNSGGALIDVSGYLIGVNTSILTRSGGSNGIGFAIPAALVSQFLEQAKKGNSRFIRPWLGIKAQPLNYEISDNLNIGSPFGILITDINKKSPLYLTGFRIGDIISAIEGKPISNVAELKFHMSLLGVGGEAKLTKVASDKKETISIELKQAPNIPPKVEMTFDQKNFFPGLKISTINPMVEEENGLEWNSEGLLVIASGEIGSHIGLRKDDIIISVNGVKLKTVFDLDKVLKKIKGVVAIAINRNGRNLLLRFRI